MTPEFFRRAAKRCRKLAAKQPASAAALISQADNHDRAAELIVELNKINEALARPFRLQPASSKALH